MELEALRRVVGSAFGAVALFSTLAATGLPTQARAESTGEAPVYYLKNHFTGENLFTLDANEAASLGEIGWDYQRVSWIAPEHSDTPVYRMYNPYNDDHLYTKDFDEYEANVAFGWEQEGVKFYSDDAETLPVYRLYDPTRTDAGAHWYTTDPEEYEAMGADGWIGEDVKWHGLRLPDADDDPAIGDQPALDLDDGPAPGEASGQAIVDYARTLIGYPYVSSGESPAEGGFDCSGLVQYVYGHFGIELPRTSYDQIAYLQDQGAWVTSCDELQPGAIIGMSGGGHVGIYAGVDPETGLHMMIDAPHPGESVQYREIYAIYWGSNFMGGGSLL